VITVWLHWGSWKVHPIYTTRFVGTRSQLNEIIREAKADNFPLRVEEA